MIDLFYYTQNLRNIIHVSCIMLETSFHNLFIWCEFYLELFYLTCLYVWCIFAGCWFPITRHIFCNILYTMTQNMLCGQQLILHNIFQFILSSGFLQILLHIFLLAIRMIYYFLQHLKISHVYNCKDNYDQNFQGSNRNIRSLG